MADLRDVVGAILRDITQARGQADEAARDMAVVYARDPILRAFTIPRIEIRELHIDLKVAVRGVDESTDDRARREQRIAEAARSSLTMLSFPVDERTIKTIATLSMTSLSREVLMRELDSSVKIAATREAETKPPKERQEVLKRLLTLYSEQVAAWAEKLMGTIKAILSAPSEKRINVEVVTTELKDIPPHMISTISLTLDVNGILPTHGEEV